MPDKAMKKFLEDVVKFDLAQIKSKELKLGKYALSNSRFYRNYFPKPKYGKTHEDILKVVRDIEKSPNKAAVITKCKYIKGAYYRYTMTWRKGKWLISDYARRCGVCKGEGCEYCKDGWVV